MSITAYYDASGREGEARDPFLEMAGVVAAVEDWTQFDLRWKAALDAEGVEEFHFTDFKGSQKQFSDWKGDGVRRERFMDSLLTVFEECTQAWYSIGADKFAFDAVGQLFVLDRVAGPYMLTARAAIIEVETWKKEHDPGAPILHIFERGDRGQRPNLRLEDLGEDVKSEPKWTGNRGWIYGLQAADLVAGEMRTLRAGIQDDDKRRIGRAPLQRIMRKPGRTSFVDTTFLARLCVMYPTLFPRRS